MLVPNLWSGITGIYELQTDIETEGANRYYKNRTAYNQEAE